MWFKFLNLHYHFKFWGWEDCFIFEYSKNTKAMLWNITTRGVTVHVFDFFRFCTHVSQTNTVFIFSGNSNNKWRFDSLWCGMTDRCINALESHFWDGSETCWYKPKTSIDSSGRDQLRFPCLNRDVPHTCDEQSASERNHSFLRTTSFNMNKHDWISHASCNCSAFQPRKHINKTAWK